MNAEHHSRNHSHHPPPPPPPPPPKLPLPWVLPSTTIQKHQDSLVCESPFEFNTGGDHHNRTYRFPLPTALTDADHDWEVTSSSHGWLILIHQESRFCYRFALLNPLSGALIPLPELVLNSKAKLLSVHSMSSHPDDPSCTLLVLDGYHNIFLWRKAADPLRWIKLAVPFWNTRLPKAQRITTAVFVHGRFYCKRRDGNLVIVADHLLPQPSVQFMDMNLLAHRYYCDHVRGCSNWMVEHNGDILMVMTNCAGSKGDAMQVYRADLSRYSWDRVEHLHGDDCALFLNLNSATGFSLSKSSLQAAAAAASGEQFNFMSSIFLMPVSSHIFLPVLIP